MKFVKEMLIIITVLSVASLAFAFDPIPKESGFSGFIAPAIGAVKYKGNNQNIERRSRIQYSGHRHAQL
jgi:hypothetical protein